jgi:hypothetical protein
MSLKAWKTIPEIKDDSKIKLGNAFERQLNKII